MLIWRYLTSLQHGCQSFKKTYLMAKMDRNVLTILTVDERIGGWREGIREGGGNKNKALTRTN